MTILLINVMQCLKKLKKKIITFPGSWRNRMCNRSLIRTGYLPNWYWRVILPKKKSNMDGVFSLLLSLRIPWYADTHPIFGRATKELWSTFGSSSSQMAIAAEMWSKACGIRFTVIRCVGGSGWWAAFSSPSCRISFSISSKSSFVPFFQLYPDLTSASPS